MARSDRRTWHWSSLDLLLVGIGFWLVAPVPVALIGGSFDSGLFVRLANSLLAGQWLGRFDALTLAKGPFYPVFLAACAAVSIPIQAGVEAVYLTGAVLMAHVVARLSGRAWAGALCLALLVFNPACTDWSVGALMREPLYGALNLLVIALAARVFLCSGGVWWGVALGFAWAAFWLTREEGVLLVPSVLLVAVWHARPLIVTGVMRLRHRPVFVDADFIPPVLPPLIALAIALALVFGVCAMNAHDYGVFRDNDFTHGAFPRAYGALLRIVPDRFQRLTPISRDMRMRAYAISAAARELQPYLEGDSAHFAVDVLCAQTGRPACHDIPGASFMWALRDAVTRAGYYTTARTADGYYKRLAREINAACARGVLRCLPPRHGLMPPLEMSDAGPIIASLAHVAWDMLLLGRAGPLVMPSNADGSEAPAYQAVTQGSAISPPARFIGAPAWEITGVMSSPDPAVSLAIIGPAATSIAANMRVTPDAAAGASLHRVGGTAQVFSAEVRCEPGDCRLALDGLGSWPVATLRSGLLLNVPQAALYIDAVREKAPFQRQGNDLRWAVMRGAAWAMELGCLVATPMALIWLGACVIRRVRINASLVLAAALLLAVVLRVGLLALLDATSIERQFRYESPVVPLLIAFVAVAMSESLRQRLGGMNHSPQQLLRQGEIIDRGFGGDGTSPPTSL